MAFVRFSVTHYLDRAVIMITTEATSKRSSMSISDAGAQSLEMRALGDFVAAGWKLQSSTRSQLSGDKESAHIAWHYLLQHEERRASGIVLNLAAFRDVKWSNE